MDDEPLELTIARQIANRDDTDPATLEPPLYEAVDVEALETLLGARGQGHAGFEGQVSFDYREYTVTVDHTRDVSVSPSTADRPQRPACGPTERTSKPGRSPSTGDDRDGRTPTDARLAHDSR